MTRLGDLAPLFLLGRPIKRPAPCESCHGTGHVPGPEEFCTCPNGLREREQETRERERIRAQMQADFAALLDRALDFGARRLKWRLETSPLADPSHPSHAAWQTCVTYAATLQDHQSNLVLYSEQVGTGKTGLAIGICQALRPWASEHRKRLYFFTEKRLYDHIKAGFDDGTRDVRIQNLCDAALLVIDDFGVTRDTEWRNETLFDLLDTRNARGLPTVLTTNLDQQALSAMVDPRLVSRLMENGDLLEVVGPDLRAP